MLQLPAELQQLALNELDLCDILRVSHVASALRKAAHDHPTFSRSISIDPYESKTAGGARRWELDVFRMRIVHKDDGALSLDLTLHNERLAMQVFDVLRVHFHRVVDFKVTYDFSLDRAEYCDLCDVLALAAPGLVDISIASSEPAPFAISSLPPSVENVMIKNFWMAHGMTQWACPAARRVVLHADGTFAIPSDLFARFPAVDSLSLRTQIDFVLVGSSTLEFEPAPPLSLVQLAISGPCMEQYFLNRFGSSLSSIHRLRWDSAELELQRCLKQTVLTLPGDLACELRAKPRRLPCTEEVYERAYDLQLKFRSLHPDASHYSRQYTIFTDDDELLDDQSPLRDWLSISRLHHLTVHVQVHGEVELASVVLVETVLLLQQLQRLTVVTHSPQWTVGRVLMSASMPYLQCLRIEAAYEDAVFRRDAWEELFIVLSNSEYKLEMAGYAKVEDIDLLKERYDVTVFNAVAESEFDWGEEDDE